MSICQKQSHDFLPTLWLNNHQKIVQRLPKLQTAVLAMKNILVLITYPKLHHRVNVYKCYILICYQVNSSEHIRYGKYVICTA